MTSQVRRLCEVSLEEVIAGLTRHAEVQGVRVTSDRVKAILLEDLENGRLKPTRLVRKLNGQVDLLQSTIDPAPFLEYGQQWLCARGLHLEPETNDYPTFPTFDADLAICEWLEGTLAPIRAGLIATYEVCDYKPHRVQTVVCALLCSPSGDDGSQVEQVRSALQALRQAQPEDAVNLAARAETTYLNIIGGLLALMIGKTPTGKPQSMYESQASIISALLAYHEGKPGIRSRTLEEKFAAARRSLAAT